VREQAVEQCRGKAVARRAIEGAGQTLAHGFDDRGFACSVRSQKNDVAGLVYEPQRTEFLNLPFVDGRLKAEIKLVEVLQKRQVRQLQPGAQIPASSRSL